MRCIVVAFLLFCFYLPCFSSYDLNLTRKFHFTTLHKMAMFFFILRLIFTRAKKSLFHIWSYHLNYRSQWPWLRARHIVFMRYTYLPNLMIIWLSSIETFKLSNGLQMLDLFVLDCLIVWYLIFDFIFFVNKYLCVHQYDIIWRRLYQSLPFDH